eukprot:TRINITY_DN16691_c0_g1_i3.p1 TRINITY_DN16691_c0_g1~~TRINITY_DN16691_c0_g1_i3.p1  ORF type:complete len:968 (+),score=326.31 TRINITY_DN16691_c0_g1_i3:110-3013(+)
MALALFAVLSLQAAGDSLRPCFARWNGSAVELCPGTEQWVAATLGVRCIEVVATIESRRARGLGADALRAAEAAEHGGALQAFPEWPAPGEGLIAAATNPGTDQRCQTLHLAMSLSAPREQAYIKAYEFMSLMSAVVFWPSLSPMDSVAFADSMVRTAGELVQVGGQGHSTFLKEVYADAVQQQLEQAQQRLGQGAETLQLDCAAQEARCDGQQPEAEAVQSALVVPVVHAAPKVGFEPFQNTSRVGAPLVLLFLRTMLPADVQDRLEAVRGAFDAYSHSAHTDVQAVAFGADAGALHKLGEMEVFNREVRVGLSINVTRWGPAFKAALEPALAKYGRDPPATGAQRHFVGHETFTSWAKLLLQKMAFSSPGKMPGVIEEVVEHLAQHSGVSRPLSGYRRQMRSVMLYGWDVAPDGTPTKAALRAAKHADARDLGNSDAIADFNEYVVRGVAVHYPAEAPVLPARLKALHDQLAKRAADLCRSILRYGGKKAVGEALRKVRNEIGAEYEKQARGNTVRTQSLVRRHMEKQMDKLRHTADDVSKALPLLAADIRERVEQERDSAIKRMLDSLGPFRDIPEAAAAAGEIRGKAEEHRRSLMDNTDAIVRRELEKWTAAAAAELDRGKVRVLFPGTERAVSGRLGELAAAAERRFDELRRGFFGRVTWPERVAEVSGALAKLRGSLAKEKEAATEENRAAVAQFIKDQSDKAEKNFVALYVHTSLPKETEEVVLMKVGGKAEAFVAGFEKAVRDKGLAESPAFEKQRALLRTALKGLICGGADFFAASGSVVENNAKAWDKEPWVQEATYEVAYSTGSEEKGTHLFRALAQHGGRAGQWDALGRALQQRLAESVCCSQKWCDKKKVCPGLCQRYSANKLLTVADWLGVLNPLHVPWQQTMLEGLGYLPRAEVTQDGGADDLARCPSKAQKPCPNVLSSKYGSAVQVVMSTVVYFIGLAAFFFVLFRCSRR